ncbi:MAG: protein kinase [Gemmatimonadales bacterium]
MNAETWARLETLFLAAIDLPPADRAEYLARVCGEDARLRAEVEAMLAAHQTGSPHQLLPSADRATAEPIGVGSRLGPYRLDELVGRGGMGEVYRATRADEQYRHQVAVKIVRAERASHELVARFLQERQIMASLAHPNIATLLDGGVSGGGQPYLVMQFVEGTPITRYARDRHLPLEAALRLFVTVCEAVQYAHTRLVVHRDLKPSNILVTDEGAPRLLDFGIAKLLDPLADTSTTGDLLLLTPEHAAPEQFLGNAVTTATDVYALGVLLYELLTGTRPFQSVPAAELAQAVCTRDPAPPSRVRPVPSDLDQVVMMALRKEPERRYASAGQLAEDVTRFLGGWPVIAQPDTARYRIRRFVSRNRTGVLAAGLVFASLAGAAGFSAWQSSRRAAALETARAERDRASRMTGFLLDIFRASNPGETRGRTVTARELLDQAAGRIADDLQDDPAVRADLSLAIGRAYGYLGQYRTSDSVISDAVNLRRSITPQDPLVLAEFIERQGRIRGTNGDLAEALRMFAEAVSLREGVLGPDALALGVSHSLIARTARALDPLDSAGTGRRHLERALAIFRAHPAEAEGLEVADVLRTLGTIADDRGEAADALRFYREALETARGSVADGDDPQLFNYRESFAHGLQAVGQADSAIAVHRSLLAARRKVFGPDHMDVSFSLFNLARDLARTGRFDEALPMFRECLALRERIVGSVHPQVAYALYSYGMATANAGDLPGALGLIDRAARTAEASLGPTNLQTQDSYEARAIIELAMGRRDAALATLELLVSRGYRNLAKADFKPLAGEARFEALRRRTT